MHPLSTSVGLRWRWTDLPSWKSEAVDGHHTSPPCKENSKMTLKKVVNFYREATGSISTGTITKWHHEMCTAHGRTEQTHLLNIKGHFEMGLYSGNKYFRNQQLKPHNSVLWIKMTDHCKRDINNVLYHTIKYHIGQSQIQIIIDASSIKTTVDSLTPPLPLERPTVQWAQDGGGVTGVKVPSEMSCGLFSDSHVGGMDGGVTSCGLQLTQTITSHTGVPALTGQRLCHAWCSEIRWGSVVCNIMRASELDLSRCCIECRS